MESESHTRFENGVGNLGLEDLERAARGHHGGTPLGLRDFVALAEAWRIAQALRDARGNRTAAARALGIGRRTLYSKMEKLGLTPVWIVGGESGETPANGNASAS